MVDSGSNDSYIKNSCSLRNASRIKLKTPHSIYIVNGLYTSYEKCKINFFGKSPEIFIVEDSFPISTGGLLGLDWELAMKAKIDRSKNVYVIKAENKNYALMPGKHPIAEIPPLQNGYKVTCDSKHKDGTYFVDDPLIIPGTYESKNGIFNLLTFNESQGYNFIYREDLIVKPRDDFSKNINEYDKILFSKITNSTSICNSQSEIWANKNVYHVKNSREVETDAYRLKCKV